MIVKGNVHVFGDDIDTDVIIPARYLNTFDHEELARHAMEGIKPEFYKTVKKGDIIVAGLNFGSGSSREHAPIAIRATGISLVIAKSFARIFYRNAFNIGLPLLELNEGIDYIKDGSTIEVDLDKGLIKELSTNKVYNAAPIPGFMQELLGAGGLMNYMEKKQRK
ncbi:MAG: 3-isopropylmalate dehydratase small subunit [Deltaproteobacteria bacterium]|nr:3-isopropylmalate dehydratase small subunit [Deltaproteobacteria bacterium]MCL5792384.1 3-isopropylmalate dehydratase small subunit [Deltaproteobacteria bacterium]